MASQELHRVGFNKSSMFEKLAVLHGLLTNSVEELHNKIHIHGNLIEESDFRRFSYLHDAIMKTGEVVLRIIFKLERGKEKSR